MIYVVCIGAGVVLGLLFRWWGLAGAVGFGIWIGSSTAVDEVPKWFLGFSFGVTVGIGVLLGIAVRRLLRSRAARPARSNTRP